MSHCNTWMLEKWCAVVCILKRATFPKMTSPLPLCLHSNHGVGEYIVLFCHDVDPLFCLPSLLAHLLWQERGTIVVIKFESGTQQTYFITSLFYSLPNTYTSNAIIICIGCPLFTSRKDWVHISCSPTSTY